MTVTAKALIESKFASSANTTEYTTPAAKHTIIDKLTATNLDASSQTITIYLVPSGSTAVDANKLISAKSIATGAIYDFTELKNHILNAGDFISVIASGASMVVIRASGREIT